MEKFKFTNSSQVDEASYDSSRKVLTVTFKTGAKYEYYAVPEEVWKGLIDAESAGKFLNQYVKVKYEYSKVG